MKKTLLISIIITSQIIGGCSRISESSEMHKARGELENKNYDKAIELLSDVLNKDPSNEEARAMYNQGRKMSKALKYEKNHDYDKAIDELNDIVNINNGSSIVKKESINKKEELERLEVQRQKDQLDRKSNAKATSKKQIIKQNALFEQEQERIKKEKNQSNEENEFINLDNEDFSNEDDATNSYNTDNNQEDSIYN